MAAAEGRLGWRLGGTAGVADMDVAGGDSGGGAGKQQMKREIQ